MENITYDKPEGPLGESNTKPKILYVDDEVGNLLVFKSAFRRHYQVYTAQSGEGGLAILKENDVSLVITDQNMPHMTGVQFLQHLPQDKDLIRMILTGSNEMDSIIKAINTCKIYRYLLKPWDWDELKMAIDNALEAFQLRRANRKLILGLKEANEDLEQKVAERTREAEKLLLNILPFEVAQELREKGEAEPRYYEKVTVLFTDFVAFSKIAEGLTPQKLIAELNDCFIAFDSIIEKNNLEKIKTIGDSYMCAGGIPTPNLTHAVDAILAALEIQAFMQTLNQTQLAKGEEPWYIRIGLHTGPIVAGVVGRKKFAYDIWGDTVNMASRMESSSEPGKINISSATFAMVKDWFNCLYRGKIASKNNREVDMYFVQDSSLTLQQLHS